MDHEMIAYFDRRFGETLTRLAALETGLAEVKEAVRQTQVMVEGLRGDVRQVAEGVIGTDETLRSLRKEITQPIDDLRSLMVHSYSTAESRIHRLESWRETRERDPIDIIRERWGRPPTPQT